MRSNPRETISHVLNGCMEFKNLYIARHNRIVKLIEEQIAVDKLDFKIHCDKIVKPEMFVKESEISDQSFSFQWVNHRRPDLLLVNKAKKNAFIVEFSVPFDRFIDLCYQHKVNKYIELCNKCNELRYHTRIIVLIIGFLGLVHNKFVNGLKVIGLATSKAKRLQSVHRLVLRLDRISVGLAGCVNECYCM